ncbi:zinc ABC transporter, periplasmic-binding protein ZnuA [Psychrobacter sp. JCM 18901]|nr:zinc ABC transporter, periplasmic-binding protein ZnuA [Psychrobacter sp. JCM 18901]
MAGSLLGCQPNNDTDAVVSGEAPVDNHAEHEQGHEMHGHEENKHEEHEDHGHEEHSDMEHGPEDQSHESHSHEEHAHAGHDHAAHASNSIPFSCEPTATIGVSYHSDSTPQTAHLLIDGIEYDLTATANSKADTDKGIYTSDIGLDDTHGIIWQVNGDKATLLNKTLDSDVAIDKEDVIFNCQKS